MNYSDIKTIDIQDGEGVRVSIYVSGCHFHCKGCHNQEAWDFNAGKKFDENTIDYILGLMDHEYIAGLSILGGEPLELINQQGLVPLVKKVKEKFPEKNIWCYTGYDFEKNVYGEMYKKYSYTKELIDNIDIIVDGQFVEEKKLVDLKFRGSTNQRKIDVQKTLKTGNIVCLKFGDESRYEDEKKQPKILFYEEFKKDKNREDSNENINAGIAKSDITLNDEKIISIKPAIEIKEVEEKISAEGIEKEIDNNL